MRKTDLTVAERTARARLDHPGLVADYKAPSRRQGRPYKAGHIKSTQQDVELMIYLYEHNWSYPNIARIFKKDHTSIMYWIRKNKAQRKLPIVVKGSEVAANELKRRKSSIPPKLATPVFGPFRAHRQIEIKEDRGKDYDQIVAESAQIVRQKYCPHNARFRDACFTCGKLLTKRKKGVLL